MQLKRRGMATDRRWLFRRIISGLLFLMCAVCAFGDPSTSDTAVLKKITHLRYSFRCLDPWWMSGAIRRSQKQIDEILAYARQSEANLDFCFSSVSNMLEAFIAECRPGVPVSKETLDKLRGRVYIEQDPERGIGVLAYLLLELAKTRGSSQLVKQSLETLYEVYVSSCYLTLSRLRNEHPDDAEIKAQLEKMNRGERIYSGSSRSMEIAWCCDRLMLQFVNSKPGYLPPSALAVCESYKQWAIFVGQPINDFHKVMQYVAQLIKEL